ncbi:hypothetical protein JCM25156A_14600 [Komagataeibacter kakiaceti JCM 25156]
MACGIFPERIIFCDKPSYDMQEWNMHKLKHVVTGVMLAVATCGPLAVAAHAGPHGGPGGGGGWGGGGPRGGGWHGGGGPGWRGGGGRWGGGWRPVRWGGGWGWGGYYPGYMGWGYPWGGWGGWGWGWAGAAMGASMGAAVAGASYQAAPEIYNATGNTAPEDDTIYDRDLSTLFATPQAPPPQPPKSCPGGQVYNDLTESCDRP